MKPGVPELVVTRLLNKISLVKVLPWLRDEPSGETLAVPPTKLTVAPAERASVEAVNTDVTFGTGSAA